MSKPNEELIQIAAQLRLDVLRMLKQAGSGHAAGPLSSADLFAYLYFDLINHIPTQPDWDERDYVLVSNGHICPIWYAALARTGYFPVKDLATLRQFGSSLQGHPWNIKTPGVFNSSGSLGHGLGQAVGVAIGLRIDNKPNHVYCVTSDGEHQEGATWEAIMSAAKYGLDNLTVIVDRNKIQIDDTTEHIMPLDDPDTYRDELADKYKSFLFNVIEIDGHNFDHMKRAFSEEERIDMKPKVIIAHTTAGKGVSFMENKSEYHDWRGDEKKAKMAIEELESYLQSIT